MHSKSLNNFIINDAEEKINSGDDEQINSDDYNENQEDERDNANSNIEVDCD